MIIFDSESPPLHLYVEGVNVGANLVKGCALGRLNQNWANNKRANEKSSSVWRSIVKLSPCSTKMHQTHQTENSVPFAI